MAYALHGCENKLAQHQSDNESRFPLSVRVPQSLSVAEHLCSHARKQTYLKFWSVNSSTGLSWPRRR